MKILILATLAMKLGSTLTRIGIKRIVEELGKTLSTKDLDEIQKTLNLSKEDSISVGRELLEVIRYVRLRSRERPNLNAKYLH